MQPAWDDLRGKLPGSETYARRELDDIKYIVIHHSGVDRDNTALEIANYHVHSLGWPGIGYSFIVNWAGTISYVGDMRSARYNVAGRNKECLGICLPGNFDARWPYTAQLKATRRLVQYLTEFLPGVQVVGHREIALSSSPTSCPGDSFHAWKAKLI